jgi:hypothetical protein
MNELQSYLLASPGLINPCRLNEHDRSLHLLEWALNLYHRARWNGMAEKVKTALLRRPCSLLDLESVPTQQVRFCRYGGLRAVDLDRIRGTQGRAGDFDGLFHPLDERLRDRWVSVAAARLQGLPLAPVSLIQVQDLYFVQDGHHRISVARAFGEAAIEAEVTIWEVAGCLPWEKVNPTLEPVYITKGIQP